MKKFMAFTALILCTVLLFGCGSEAPATTQQPGADTANGNIDTANGKADTTNGNADTDPALNYYYNENNTAYEPNKVVIRPKYVYWENNSLVAECFVINGCAESVTNINIADFSLSNANELIASSAFGLLEGETLEPYTYSVWTLTFHNGISAPGADLTGGLYAFSTTTFDTVPKYDMSKASGILAGLGVSEGEFRSRCQRLFSSNFQIGRTDGTEAYYRELLENPGNYIDKWFVVDNISGYDYVCTYKGTTSDGYPFYENLDDYDPYAVIYDFRDDPYSPNISRDDYFTPYVIFKGVKTVNGNDWLVFWMITVDK